MAWYTVYILPNNNYIVQELDEGITKEQVDTVNDTLHKIANVRGEDINGEYFRIPTKVYKNTVTRIIKSDAPRENLEIVIKARLEGRILKEMVS